MAIYSEFSHRIWRYSIVMLVYQRVPKNPGGNPLSERDSRLQQTQDQGPGPKI
jgi:hypothetical protein